METSVPKSETNPNAEAEAPPRTLSPAQRAQKLFGDLFGAKKPKDRAKAMQEFAALSPGEQAFVQSELLYLMLLGQERLRSTVLDLSDQMDESTDALIESIESLIPRSDDPLGLFDRPDEAEEVQDDDANGEDLDGDDGDEDDDANGEDDELELEDNDDDDDDNTPEAA